MVLTASAQQTLNLSGKWQVRLGTGKELFEAKVGKGSLIFSSIDLLTDAHLPELRQMQYSLVQYMLSDAFKPAMQLSEQDVRSLILEKSVDQKTDANSIYN